MTWQIVHGDCIKVMASLPAASVDAIVTDPPYGLEFMGREWDRLGGGGSGRTRGAVHEPTLEARNDTPQHRSAVKQPSYLKRCAKCGGNSSGAWGRCSCETPDFRERSDLKRAMQDWHEAWAREALRVLKPGGHLLAFGGTRTYHRLTCAIEDAGFEVRDCIAWMYGQGFPKSMNVGCRCGEGESATEHDVCDVPDEDVSAPVGVEGGQGPVLLAGLPQSSAPAIGTVPATRSARGTERVMEGRDHVLAEGGQLPGDQVRQGAIVGTADGASGRLCDGASPAHGADDRPTTDASRGGTSSRPRSAEQRAAESRTVAVEPRSQDGGGWSLCPGCGKPTAGLGTALKPSFEPIVVARKPLAGTVAANVLVHGTGALNVGDCRVGTAERPVMVRTDTVVGANAMSGESTGATSNGETTTLGRWPANVVLDPEAAAVLDKQTGELHSQDPATRNGGRKPGWSPAGTARPMLDKSNPNGGDTGGASRFFYVAKTDSAERNAGLSVTTLFTPADAPTRNDHPTVKPIALMRWLVRLVTPPGGLVVDPFAGSGTTGCAAVLEGFDFVGIEREEASVGIARARIAYWSNGTTEDAA